MESIVLGGQPVFPIKEQRGGRIPWGKGLKMWGDHPKIPVDLGKGWAWVWLLTGMTCSLGSDQGQQGYKREWI